MDIGDVNEIPTTRRKLPSMQELGAFDFDTPVDSRPNDGARPASKAPAATPPTATPSAAAQPRQPAAPAVAPPAPAAPARPRATSEQIREALAKADPQTRKRLLRLIAGGRTVQQRGEQAPQSGEKSAALMMSLQRPQTPARPAAPAVSPQNRQAAGSRVESAAVGNPPPRTDRSAKAEQPLMQIDGNTDLLDALPPAVDAEQNRAALLARLAAAKADEAPPQVRTAAHKVLFPAYDPREHGDDVRRPGRKADAPVEGHFPAPRQPFQASYQHADGRPMDEEETRVEEVLQEQRCEQTLEVLARDGVNGLLLSPRDLDAAVDNGVLDAETAELLWKTWSALRPVIHVIEDPPAAEATALPSEAEAVDAAAATDEVDSGVAAVDPPSTPLATPSTVATGHRQAAAAQAVETVTVADPDIVSRPADPAVRNAPPKPPDTVAVAPRAATAIASPEPAVQSKSASSASVSQNRGTEPVPPRLESASSRWQRLKNALHSLGRAIVVGCVISTGAQIAWWAWRHGGHGLLP